MADFYDMATAREELDRQQAIEAQAAIAAATPKLTPTGECLNPLCGEEFGQDEPGRLFCGPQCAEEHDKFTR